MTPRRTNMWLENLIELKKKSGMTSKQIANGTFMPERTVSRIFHKETDNPSVTTLIPIINFLGGSFDEIFADTKAIICDTNIVDLQKNLDTVTVEKENITAERDMLLADNKILSEKVNTLTNEIELLKMQIMYKDKIIATHEYYNTLIKK